MTHGNLPNQVEALSLFERNELGARFGVEALTCTLTNERDFPYSKRVLARAKIEFACSI